LRAVMGTMPTPVVAKRSRVNAELAFMNRLVVARPICRSGRVLKASRHYSSQFECPALL
jgi:hypothetical protein